MHNKFFGNSTRCRLFCWKWNQVGCWCGGQIGIFCSSMYLLFYFFTVIQLIRCASTLKWQVSLLVNFNNLLVSEWSEHNAIRVNTIEDNCLFVCVWTYVCHFVLWPSRRPRPIRHETEYFGLSNFTSITQRNWIVYRFEFFCGCS